MNPVAPQLPESRLQLGPSPVIGIPPKRQEDYCKQYYTQFRYSRASRIQEVEYANSHTTRENGALQENLVRHRIRRLLMSLLASFALSVIHIESCDPFDNVPEVRQGFTEAVYRRRPNAITYQNAQFAYRQIWVG